MPAMPDGLPRVSEGVRSWLSSSTCSASSTRFTFLTRGRAREGVHPHGALLAVREGDRGLLSARVVEESPAALPILRREEVVVVATVKPLTVLNLGWGRQSMTLAAMMALDVMPRADYLVHANTTHERAATYEYAKAMTPWLGEHGLDVVTVRGRRTAVVVGGRWGIHPNYYSAPYSRSLKRRFP